ncbi:MAG: GAF domain-containing protein [Anaerolineae bacterium]
MTSIGGAVFAGFEVAAIYLAVRGYRDRAIYAVMASVVFDLIVVMLVLRGIDGYIVAGGVLLLLVVGQIIAPRRWGLRLVAMGALVALALFIRLVEPLPRYDLALDMTASVVPPMAFIVLILAFALVGIRIAQSGRIRTRLIISFGLVALIPGMLIASVSVVFGLRSSERRILDELEAAARVREDRLTTWLEDLQLDLLALRELEASGLSTLLTAERDSQAFLDTYTLQKSRLMNMLAVRENFATVLLVGRDGTVVFSTDPVDELQDFSDTAYVREGLAGPYVSIFEPSASSGEALVTLAIPVRGLDGEVAGVLIGRTSAERVGEIVRDRTGLDTSTEIYLVDPDHRLFTGVVSGPSVGEVVEAPGGVNQVIAVQADDRGRYRNHNGEPVLGVYRWLPSLNFGVVIEAPRSWTARTAMTMVGMNLALTFISVAVAVGFSIFIARDIAGPLQEVSEVATEIAEGELNRMVPVTRGDEIGALAVAFNRMTTRLREMVADLEERVALRTVDLERRSVQVETAARVARQAASIRDVDALPEVAAQQIAEQFGFYHVGVYLIDDARRRAVMRASSPGGGERLLEEGFRMAVGAPGIIGDVAATGEPRIALDMADDAQPLVVSELANARSEISLPFRVRGEVTGVLDIQSDKPAFFSQDDVAYLQIMADQIGLAIENARLLEEAEQRIREIGRLVLRQQQQGWHRLASQRPQWSYIYDGLEIQPLDTSLYALDKPDVVLSLGGTEEAIGVVKVALGNGRRLSQDDINLARAITEEAGRALERARLFGDTQEALLEAGALYRGSRAIVDASTVDEVLLAFVKHLATAAVDCCVLMMRDVRPVLGVEEVHVSAIWNSVTGSTDLVGRRWPIEAMPFLCETPEGTRTIVDIGDAAGLDPRSRQMLSKTFGMESILIIPLLTHQVLGWLLVGSVSDRHAFTQREIRLYRGLADQAATVLQNFQLLDLATDQAERERLVSTLGSRIRNSTDVETILQTSVRELSRVLQASEGTIRLQAAERNGHAPQDDQEFRASDRRDLSEAEEDA